MTEQLTTSLFTKIALQRADSQLDAPTRALISTCSFELDYHNEYWNLLFIAPNRATWKRIVKRSESITRCFTRVMNAFTVSFWLKFDPMPLNYPSIWRVQRTVLINDKLWAQIQQEHYPYWLSMTHHELLSQIKLQEPTLKAESICYHLRSDVMPKWSPEVAGDVMLWSTVVAGDA